MKRLVTLACAAAMVVGFGGSASADCHPGSSRTGEEPVYVQNPATDGYVYADGGMNGGYIGTWGTTGYLEATGDADEQSVQVHGQAHGVGAMSVGTEGQEVCAEN